MKIKDDSMKLCVLVNEIKYEPLYEKYGLYLYKIPINEYKKQLLKNNVNLDIEQCAYMCYSFAIDILHSRFELGEEIICKLSHGIVTIMHYTY